MKKIRIAACIIAVCFVSSTAYFAVTFVRNSEFFEILLELLEPPLTKERMERHFARDYELLSEMVTHIMNFDYETVVITRYMEDGEMSVGGRRIEIEDVEVLNAINRLKRRGYRVIDKGDNAISFVRWSNMDNGRGVVYSLDGNEPSSDYTLPFLTRLEPLSKTNWFYYEEDFNEWRVRQRTNED